ncbi:uncharacterized protein [Epargyreus clarus]|uniref:uncharacterized protein n=1 Tax=Epargyreus clarus TaxID=520877 RepID=UPI003C2AC397
MSGYITDDTKRLYLEVGPNGNISVPGIGLAKHQIDGIRFLFEKYRKGKPGVLVNYSACSGRRVMVVLFISSIIEELERPVLIIYKHNQEKEDWVQLFGAWTTVKKDDIAVDPANIFVRSKIILKSMSDMSTCCNRVWSMLAVNIEHDDDTMCKMQLKVDFKIWITAIDLKEHLEILGPIYTWINGPLDSRLKELFEGNIIMFEDELEAPLVPLSQELLLDSCLDEFMIRRSMLRRFIYNKPETKHTSRKSKNKDASGTKRKRSRNYPDVPKFTEAPEPECSTKTENSHAKVDDGTSTSTNHSKKPRTDTNEKEESKMDVESFIRDNEPLASDSNSNMAIEKLDDKVLDPNVKDTVKTEEANSDSSLDFGNAVDDIVKVENNISNEKVIAQSSQSYSVVKDLENTKHFEEVVFNPMDVYTPKIQNVFSISADGENSKQELGKDGDGTRSGYEMNVDGTCIGNDKVENTRNDGGIKGDDESCIGDDGDKSTCSVNDGTENANISIGDKEIKGEHASSHGGEPTKEEITQGKIKESNNETVDQESKVKVTNVKKETDDVFDSKMKEIEEQALKKFKGSVLDNMF